ncbi:outer membrane channel protein TolC [Alkalimonas collagenimarina]|uniref:Outer membrane channel protein TolC n=1 Tax=Alkalimonas collagenimarina TaxID=400390 RepID=A0ABT9GYN5_9GAMM|nr:outer membrane channel protein TolC [Alkalimonas collagenimarina]MDP4536175.1 outer membrane channel protein TolC [Alkalimonas collagenimarina]
MNKKLLATLLCSSFGVFSLPASADNLQSVYQLATQKDPVVLRAAASRDAAAARIDIVKAELLPSIGFTTSLTRADRRDWTFSDDRTILSGDIRLEQSIYDRRNWQSLTIEEKRALQAQTIYNSTAQTLIVRVTDGYFNVLKAKDDLTFIQAEKRSIERQLEQTKQRFAVGLTAITDVHEAQAQYDNALAREISTENALEFALEQLREITGRYHDDLATLNTDRFSTAPLSPAEPQQWLNIAEENNFELQAQRIGLEIARLEIDRARSGHLPTLGLEANIGSSKERGYNQNFTQFATSPREDSSSIGVALRVPIFSGGRTNAGVNVAQANFVETSEQMEQTYRSTVRQVRNSFNNVRALASSIRALEQAVVSANSALQATEAGFEVGTRTIVDVLVSTRNLFDARRNLSRARYDYILSVLDLKLAAGNLTEQDLLDINSALFRS